VVGVYLIVVLLAVAVPCDAADATVTLTAAPPERFSVIGLLVELKETVALTAAATGGATTLKLALATPSAVSVSPVPAALTWNVPVVMPVVLSEVRGDPVSVPVPVSVTGSEIVCVPAKLSVFPCSVSVTAAVKFVAGIVMLGGCVDQVAA